VFAGAPWAAEPWAWWAEHFWGPPIPTDWVTPLWGRGSDSWLVLKSASERFGWRDVAAVGLFGGAIGSAPLGSAAGFLGGSAVGFVLWGLIDAFETPDLLGAAIAGLALGGITEWLVRGIDAQSSGGPELQWTRAAVVPVHASGVLRMLARVRIRLCAAAGGLALFGCMPSHRMTPTLAPARSCPDTSSESWYFPETGGESPG